MRFAAATVLVLLAASASAQEPAETQEQARSERRELRVLEHPYDIASFYRNERPGYFDRVSERYPLASYYRGAVNPNGYSRFYTSDASRRPRYVLFANGWGYGAYRKLRRPAPNGTELFLMVPTLLAPVPALNDAVYGPDR